MKQPKVSVLIPCYNYGNYVTECVESILAQTMQDFEVIVIDDCSTDDTKEVLKKYGTNPRIRIIRHQENKGLVSVLNEGIGLSNGQYIMIISADDFSKPAHSEKITAVLDKHPAVGFVYSASNIVDRDSRFIRVHKPFAEDYIKKGVEELKQLLSKFVMPSAITFRRQCFEKLGVHDLAYPYGSQLDMKLRICLHYDTAYVAEVLVNWRSHGQNMSVAYDRGQASMDIYRIIMKYIDYIPREEKSTKEEVLKKAIGELKDAAWYACEAGDARTSRHRLSMAIRKDRKCIFDKFFIKTFLRTFLKCKVRL